MNRIHAVQQPGGLARIDEPAAPPPHPRAVPGTVAAWGTCAAVVLLWGVLRLAVFSDQIFPLTFVLPLLVCIWTRRVGMLWGMAAVFVAMAAAEAFWVMPEALRRPAQDSAALAATVFNIAAGSAAVHIIIVLRARLERSASDLAAANAELNQANEELAGQAEELSTQNEMLADQAEELRRQTEEANQQAEELAQQNEELQSQAEEIEQLNTALTRREALLQTLLDAARLAVGEQAALEDICAAAAGMFEGPVAVVVYERRLEGLVMRAASGLDPGSPPPGVLPMDRSLAGLALAQEHTAALPDAALRPDLILLGSADHPFVSALAAPLRLPGRSGGALTVLHRERRDWTEIQFRLAEWLAQQCGRILETLRTQELVRRQAALIDLTPDAVMVRAEDGSIRFWSLGAEAMYGWPASEAVGRCAHELLHTRFPEPPAAIAEHLGREGRWTGELTHRTRDGRDVIVQSRWLLRPDPESGIEVLESNVDVTARKQAEIGLLAAKANLEDMVRERTADLARSVAELERANAELARRAAQLRALAGDLTATEQRERKRLSQILHDGLQQHLVAAKLQLGGLAGPDGDGEVARTAAQVEQLLNESIQISRSLSAELSPPILQDGGLADALLWLQRWMREKHDFDVEVAVETDLEPAPEIKTLVFESVRELLFNCVKHAATARAVVRVTGANGGALEVRVSDEGCGFDPARMGPAGNGGGFGLFSIRERIQLAGGELRIDSIPGGGTRVLLRVPHARIDATVPAGAGPEPAVPPPPTVAPGPSGRIRVLLADDHAIVRDGIARLIGKEPDMEVVGAARDGREAIELARRLAPDVILMDIGMPEVSGIEATQAIHRERPGIRIIGLSMHEHHEHAQVMREAGAVDYRTKDCAPSELLAAVRSCAGGRSARPSPSAPSDARVTGPGA